MAAIQVDAERPYLREPVRHRRPVIVCANNAHNQPTLPAAPDATNSDALGHFFRATELRNSFTSARHRARSNRAIGRANDAACCSGTATHARPSRHGQRRPRPAQKIATSSSTRQPQSALFSAADTCWAWALGAANETAAHCASYTTLGDVGALCWPHQVRASNATTSLDVDGHDVGNGNGTTVKQIGRDHRRTQAYGRPPALGWRALRTRHLDRQYRRVQTHGVQRRIA